MDNALTPIAPTPLVPASPGIAARWQALPARTQMLGAARRRRAGGGAAGTVVRHPQRRLARAVPQPVGKGRRPGHRPADAAERALPLHRRRRHAAGAGGARARTAHEAGRRRPAQRRRHGQRRLRTARQEQLRPDPGPGTHEDAARHRGRAHDHHPVAGVGEGGARAPGAAADERLLPRTAEALGLGRADAAPRPHARPQPDRRHRARRLGQRARTGRPRRERGRQHRRAAVRRRARTRPRRGWTRSSCSTAARSRPSHLKRVLALLEPVVGRDNVRASVSAEIDFSQVMQTAEAYRPNQGARRAGSRCASSAARSRRSPAAPPPAACPAPPATSRRRRPRRPSTARRRRCRPPAAAAASVAARREAATRYEVDKTVTVTRNAAGTVRRLSAAVVVNHRTGDRRQGQAHARRR